MKYSNRQFNAARPLNGDQDIVHTRQKKLQISLRDATRNHNRVPASSPRTPSHHSMTLKLQTLKLQTLKLQTLKL